MQTKVRVVTIQADANGQLLGASITYDVTLPDGTVTQNQLDVTAWAQAHSQALQSHLDQASAAVAARFA